MKTSFLIYAFLFIALPISSQNYSLDFDGTDDYVDLDNIPASFDYTVEFWMNLSSVTDDDRILSAISTHTSIYNIYIKGDKLGISRGSTGGPVTVSTTTITAGTWYHVAFVRKSTTEVEVYLDGVQEASTVIVGSELEFVDKQTLCQPFGIPSPINGNYANGKIDEFRVWDGPRTQTEIQNNMHTELTGQEANLVAYYKFDDNASVNDIEDCTSNGYHSTRHGSSGSNNLPQFVTDQPSGLTDVACGACCQDPCLIDELSFGIELLETADTIIPNQFGKFLDMSDDRLAVYNGRMKVHIYERNNITFDHNEVAIIELGFIPDNLEIDGDFFVVGNRYDNDNGIQAGAVHVYAFDGTNWNETKLLASDGDDGDNLGNHVAIDGSRIVASAPLDEAGGSWRGSVYVFEWDGTNWNETAKISPSGSQDNLFFGREVGVSQNRIVAARSTSGANDEQVYVYDFDGTNWNETIISTSTSEWLGSQVAIDGDRFISGAGDGKTFLFEWDGTVWNETILQASAGSFGNLFGYDNSIANDVIAVGDPSTDEYGNNSGSLYTFYFNGTNWIENKITPCNLGVNDQFGYAVSTLNGNVLADARRFRPYEYYTSVDHGGAFFMTLDCQTASINPVAQCLDLNASLDIEGTLNLLLSQIDDGSYDNCPFQSLTLSQSSFDTNDLGVQTVTLTVTDSDSNTDQCSAQVTLADYPFKDLTLCTSTNVCSSDSVIISFCNVEPYDSLYLNYMLNGGSVTYFSDTISGPCVDLNLGILAMGSYSFSLMDFGYHPSYLTSSVLTQNITVHSTGSSLYYPDSDQDGMGDANSPGITSCFSMPGYTTDSSDCNDFNSQIQCQVSLCDFSDTTNCLALHKISKPVGYENSGTAYSNYGSSLAYDNDMLVIGLSTGFGGVDDGGVVMLKEKDGKDWVERLLIPENSSGGDKFGAQVDKNGDRIIVGAPGDTEDGVQSLQPNAGSVYIFDWDGTQWNQTKVFASDATPEDKFGSSLSLGNDRFVVGAPGAEAAYVFDWDGTNWNETILTPSDGFNHSNDFGESVDLDGDQLIVGAPKYDLPNNPYTGSAYMYTYDGTSWNEQKFIPSDGGGGDGFGWQVQIENNYVVVGSISNDCLSNFLGGGSFNAGAVYIYENVAGTYEESKIGLSDSNLVFPSYTGSGLGNRIALESGKLLISTKFDVLGDKIIYYFDDLSEINSFEEFNLGDHGNNPVGSMCIGDDSFYASFVFGQVRQYRFTDLSFSEEILPDNPYRSDGFGYSVAVSGTNYIVGAPRYTNANYREMGRAHIYSYDGTNYTEHVLEPILPDPVVSNNFRFGHAVDIDGTRAVIGTYLGYYIPGIAAEAVYAFDWDGTNWNPTKLTQSDFSNSDNFGTAVSLEGNRVVVGAYADDNANGSFAGSIYVFDYDGTNWIETKIIASDGTPSDWFGYSVDQSGDRIVVGAKQAGTTFTQGAVYVYDWDGTNWNETKIIPSLNAAGRFGTDVSLDGDRMIVSDPSSSNFPNNYKGAVYIYDYDGNSWTETRITPLTTKKDQDYGASVDIQGDFAIVGMPGVSPFYNTNVTNVGGNSGAVSFLTFDGTSWNASEKYITDFLGEENIGFAVDVDNGKFFIGSDSRLGRVYVGELATCPGTLTVNDIPISDGIYNANDTIISSGLVPVNGNVIFQAGSQIMLEPLFEVDNGSIFEAIIQPCSN